MYVCVFVCVCVVISGNTDVLIYCVLGEADLGIHISVSICHSRSG